jgi:hypothetical protein
MKAQRPLLAGDDGSAVKPAQLIATAAAGTG